MILPRLADTAVRAVLDRQAAVALIGPRQVGKTTLARGIGDERAALYLDLESRIVYAGDDRYPLAEDVEAIGVREIAELVAGA